MPGRDALGVDRLDGGPVAGVIGRISSTTRQTRLAAVERWATFDCYGTLVDWNGGIRAELEKLFGVERADELLVRYHELEPQDPGGEPRASSYREVLTIALERLAAETGLTLPEGEASALARSLPNWPVFDDVHDGPDGGARARLAARDPLQHRPRSHRRVDGRDRRARSTSPSSPARSGRTSRRTGTGRCSASASGADSIRHVHVAQSLFHDIAPATELGIPTIWINRLDEPEDPRPTRTL